MPVSGRVPDETYLRMLGALSRSQVEHPSAFLFQVARNVALRMRNRQRFEGTVFQAMTDLDLAEIADGYAVPERQVIARQELRRLAAAIDELPPRCREVFLLTRFEALSNGEAAARLGSSQPTLSRQIATLEKLVGAPLFERSKRGLLPTAQAQALAEPAARMLAAAQAVAQAADSASSRAGQLPARCASPPATW